MGVTSWGWEGAIPGASGLIPQGLWGHLRAWGQVALEMPGREQGGHSWGLLCPSILCPPWCPCAGERRGTPTGSRDMGIREHGEFRDRGREIWGLGDEQNGAMGIQGQGDGGHGATGT